MEIVLESENYGLIEDMKMNNDAINILEKF